MKKDACDCDFLMIFVHSGLVVHCKSLEEARPHNIVQDSDYIMLILAVQSDLTLFMPFLRRNGLSMVCRVLIML